MATMIEYDTLPNLLQRRQEEVADNQLTGIRARAAESFARLGFPPPNAEQWRYINLAPIVSAEYRLPEPGATATLDQDVTLGDAAVAELVFVDGSYSAELSTVPELPAGLTISTLREASRTPEFLEQTLGSVADSQAHPFVALNTALFDDLAIIHIADGVAIEKPVHLVFLAGSGGQPSVISTRVLVVAGRASQASIVETYFGRDGAYLTNAVTEVIAGPGSNLQHVKIERESSSATHIGYFRAVMERDASITSNVISFGGLVVRNELCASLNGEGADCSLYGLYLLGGNQKVDNHTTIDHLRPHTNSRQLYKGILDGKSNGIFEGMIIVRPDAQKITSSQTNNNLVLSQQAIADSKPQLEIHADDVKCAHGSTIGQLEEEKLFYLISRGIGRAEAENLLTFGFAAEVIERITTPRLRQQIEHCLTERVPLAEELE
jgi:Fe-S cluster assembly protein SufD